MFETAVRKPFLASVVFASVLSTLPASAQSGAVTMAGAPVSGTMSTQDIMQAGLSQPAPAPDPAALAVQTAPAATPARHEVNAWALAAWVSVGVVLAFGYMLRRKVW